MRSISHPSPLGALRPPVHRAKDRTRGFPEKIKIKIKNWTTQKTSQTHLAHSLDLHPIALVFARKPRIRTQHLPRQRLLTLVHHHGEQLVMLQRGV